VTDDLVAQAWELLSAQRTDEGLALFGEAVARAPHDDRVFHERGAAFAVLRRYDEAMRDLTRALTLRPTARAYSDRGGVYLSLGRDSEGRADLRRALARDPELAAAHMNLARSLKDDDPAAAARYLREAVRLGEERAVAPLERLRQELFVAATDDGTMALAIDAVLRAETVEDLVELIDRFPFVALPQFTDGLIGHADRLPASAAAALEDLAARLRALAMP
jgi:Flp pilus assembly protein TadD